MERREALKRLTLLFGGAIIGGQLFLEGCARKASADVATLFEEEQIAFLAEIAETILPKTSTPGAKEAGVGAFIPVMVRDCYTDEEQKVFLEGLKHIRDRSEKEYKNAFEKLTAEQRNKLLVAIDGERAEQEKSRPADGVHHYFSMLRQLTLLGFFSSELGATQALRYVAIPGKYDGNLDYKKGDKAWAT